MSVQSVRAKRNGWAWIVPVSLAVLVANVAAHVLYMAVYGYLVNPGQAAEHYERHAQVSAPYSSILVGMPLMFFAGRWIGGKFEARHRITAALLMWLVYLLIDVIVLVFARASIPSARYNIVVGLALISAVTKLLAAYLGGRASALSRSVK